MNVGSYKLNEYLILTANTHDPATGAAQDADSDPTYRIYEDGNPVPIATGTLSIFDNGNTTGLYVDRIQLTAAAGYENGKAYSAYITATVNGITGTITHTFKVDSGSATFPAGSVNFTYTVTSTQTGFPIPGVDVWVSTDVTGLNVIWRGTTDTFGVARDVQSQLPALDPGTYYFWRQRPGFSGTDPDQEVVS